LMLPLALLVAALALSACGGGGSSSSGSSTSGSTESSGSEESSGGSPADEAAIEETIRKASTTNAPTKCTELQTEHFNEEGGRLTATQGLIACEQVNEEGSAPANKVEVTSIDMEGNKATAEAALEGSTLNGQTLEIELVKEGGKWKMNQFVGFKHYDATAVAEGIEQRLKGSHVPGKVVKCVGAGYAKFSQEEAEEISLQGNLEPVEELLKSCE
jgi:hypothetical protein